MIRQWARAWLPPEARRWIVATLLFMALFAGAVWWYTRPVPAPETPAPAQRQADGSLILARQPDPAAPPKQQLPPRAKLERVVSVTVQPRAPSPAPGQPCPPVTVDLSLIKEPDGARRILASSPDGQIVGGLDVPVEPIVMPAPANRWGAGLSWSPINRTSGIWIERDMRIPLVNVVARVGLDINQAGGVQTSASGIDARVRVGIAF
jgi:hypothetical protein